MKLLLKIFLFLYCFTNVKAQLLFYQDTYKGGVSVDGRSYYGSDCLQADLINFQNIAPIGSILKKAFLISNHYVLQAPATKDNNISLVFNGTTITIDSSDIASSYYSCSGSKIDVVVKDVSVYALLNNNQLITPNQTVLMLNDTSRHYIYYGFLLVVLYENNIMPATNACVFLNSGNHSNPTTYNFMGINPVNTSKDVGLSIWVNDIGPLSDSLGFSVNSSYLGAIYPTVAYGNENTLPGSFYYQNNTLFGLQDDVNSPFIHGTDAIANIKSYLPNNANNFTLTTDNSITCLVNNFTLAYTTPCPAQSNKDTTLIYDICRGNSTQLNGTSNGTYTWSAANNSLNHYNIPNPVASPTVTTTYIALVDSAGCKHTEHFMVNVHNLPQIKSVQTTTVICGNFILGTATVNANNGTKPYTYNIGNTSQTSNTFTNIAVATYTATLTDSVGCIATPQTFTITEVNIAQANFIPKPDTGCAPAAIYFNNTSINTNTQEWYINGDSLNTQSPTYTFTDTGIYQITLIAWHNQRQCSDTVTKTITVKDCPPDSIHITVPNIFSPNADGINEVWQLTVYNFNYTVSNYACTIYDRWGIKVFETSNISEAWNGRTTSGLPCSAGTYYYIIKLKATNSKGKSEDKDFKGYLELVR